MPLSFALKPAFGSLLMAVIKKMRSPHTIGLECDKPGIVVFQRMFSPFSAFQVVGGLVPSATPEALVPRNEGQFWALAVMKNASNSKSMRKCFMANCSRP